MIAGTIYGVVLNDRVERAALAAAFAEKPYGAAPVAPVVYTKPRSCLAGDGAAIVAPQPLRIGATLALLFRRDAAAVTPEDAFDAVGAAALAIDLMIPSDSYYRPTIAQRNGDGFLPLGQFGAPTLPDEIVTRIDGAIAHRWSLDRLASPAAALIAELSQFMTFQGGDVLLIGLAGDAPIASAGQRIGITAAGHAPLDITLRETAA